jgi:hypothetical protein
MKRADIRPIVHIGYHKTATTWFQRSVYPAATSHDFVPRARVQQALLDPPGMAFDPAKARAILGAADEGRPLLLCEENLSGYIHNGGLHGFLPPAAARRIRQVLPDAQIVIFVRSQASMAAACYLQYVRGGGTHMIRRYLFPSAWLRGAYAQKFKVPRFSFEHLEYDRLVGLYDDLFGRGNVHVYPYESLGEPRALLRRMEVDLGLRLDPGRLRFDRPNPSWSGRLLPLARFLNHFTARTVEDKRYRLHIPGFYLVRAAALSGLSRIFRDSSPRPLLSAGLEGWIERRFATSNERLRALRPGLLPDGFYTATAEGPPGPVPDEAPEPPPLRALLAGQWALLLGLFLLALLGAVTLIRWVV